MKLHELLETSSNKYADYVMDNYYVYGGNDVDDITIEEHKQKYRVIIGHKGARVYADDPENTARAKQIQREINGKPQMSQSMQAKAMGIL